MQNVNGAKSAMIVNSEKDEMDERGEVDVKDAKDEKIKGMQRMFRNSSMRVVSRM